MHCKGDELNGPRPSGLDEPPADRQAKDGIQLNQLIDKQLKPNLEI